MSSNVLHLMVFGVITTMLAPTTFAIETPQIIVTTIGNTVIDLNSPEKDRKIHSFADFINYDIEDEYFVVKIIQESTGQIIKESHITVQSTSSGLVNFLSQVIFLVNNEMVESSEVTTGNYHMEITTIDGSASAIVPFSIIDTSD